SGAAGGVAGGERARALPGRARFRVARARGGRSMSRSAAVCALLCGAAALVAPGESLAAPAEARFALVVANNRSLAGERPDLQYADDDGVRYYALFRMVAPESNVVLLTT